MEPGPVETQRLTETMADKAPVWDEVVRAHGLQPNSFESLAAWPFGDDCLGCDYDVMSFPPLFAAASPWLSPCDSSCYPTVERVRP